uniref:Uncharacterized protein n=1 Tax=Leersia perrieri TaxID=77586 RepID=A0A0D9XUY9_9ORYZ
MALLAAPQGQACHIGGAMTRCLLGFSTSFAAYLTDALIIVLLLIWDRLFDHSKAFTFFVIEVVEKSVSGLVALNSLGASYFLAWAKKDSVCIKKNTIVWRVM